MSRGIVWKGSTYRVCVVTLGVDDVSSDIAVEVLGVIDVLSEIVVCNTKLS